MNSNRLWSPAFINYGISSGILYMTQYVLVAALPIVITSELSGGDLDAGCRTGDDIFSNRHYFM